MHAALPQTMTPENLGQWISENRKDTIAAKGTTILSADERTEYEHISSSCSQKIDELDETAKTFTEYINNGTYNPDVDEENGKNVQIPATVGKKKLTEERKRVDKILRDGHTVEKTTLYVIPWPERKKMVAFDIEGQEWDEYTRDMREDEINAHRTLFEEAPVGEAVMEVSSGEELIQEEVIHVPAEPAEELPKRRARRGQTEDPII